MPHKEQLAVGVCRARGDVLCMQWWSQPGDANEQPCGSLLPCRAQAAPWTTPWAYPRQGWPPRQGPRVPGQRPRQGCPPRPWRQRAFASMLLVSIAYMTVEAQPVPAGPRGVGPLHSLASTISLQLYLESYILSFTPSFTYSAP